MPGNRLSEEERKVILETCNAPEHADLPPSQIVPRLADEGIYLASESSFYRVLRPVFVKIVVTFFTQLLLYCRVPRVHRRHAQD